nr:MAG TPA: hypothetical protein [Caudoviricetes sp.]
MRGAVTKLQLLQVFYKLIERHICREKNRVINVPSHVRKKVL